MRDAVTEINIDNPVAKEAFIRWWRTMEAQGYQYGFEALCNVWVGFDDGRADLIRKVLTAVQERLTANDSEYNNGIHDALAAICRVCAKEGVEIE